MRTERATSAVRSYVWTVAVGGGVLATSAAVWGPAGHADPLAAWILAIAALVSVWAPLRIRYRGESAGFTFEEAAFVALLFVLPGRYVPVLLAGTALLGHLVRRGAPVKLAFNVGQVAVWASAATWVFHGVFPGGDVLTARSIAAAFLATLTHNLVNAALMGGLFKRLGDDHLASLMQRGRLHVVMWLGNTALGLLLAFLALQDLRATVLALPLMIGLYLGYRGYAGVLEERGRTERLHEVTQTLASATGSPDALGRFLQQLTRLFGAERAEIVVVVRDRARYLTAQTDGEVVDRTGQPLPRLLDDALHRTSAILHTETDADANDRDALSTPLTMEGRTVGALAVYDRHGLEPWDGTDVRLLATLANEVVVAVRNVELVAELSEETRKLGNIVTAASDGIALLDTHGRVLTWNRAFACMTGLPDDRVLGRDLRDVLSIDAADERFRHAVGTALGGGGSDHPVDVEVARDAEDVRWLRCTFAPVDAEGDGDRSGAVVLARDVTRERETEQLKSDFIATVSHELRTPLTPLKGFLVMALHHWESLDRDQLWSMVTAMQRQVERLEVLIADLLVVADLERPGASLDRGTVALHVLVEGIGSTFPQELSDRLRISTDGAVDGVGDTQAAQRVVRVLVDNALKHTSGTVEVTAAVVGEEAVVRVSDEGPGIRTWERDVIFERFGRLGDHLTRTQGPGLGLAIARSLTERLGGRLELDSTPGSGSTFTLALPRAASDGAPASDRRGDVRPAEAIGEPA